MINEMERVQYREYPILLILLETVENKWKSKLIKSIVNRYNKRTVDFYSSCFQDRQNVEMNLYLLNLIYRDFKSGLEDTKLSSLEKQRMNGYLKAKWREYRKWISMM